MKIREFFKRYTNTEWYVDGIEYFFNMNKTEANELLNEFEKEGFVEKDRNFNDEQLWHNTIKGNSLALASAAKPIYRATANKKIDEFLTRVIEVNKNDYYSYKIEKVVVFGSYLGSSERLGDVDIAIKVGQKEMNPDTWSKLAKDRSSKAKEKGRHFNNIVEEIFWSQVEVFRYLKSHSRSISIHDIEDGVLVKAEYKVIFEES